MNKEIKKLSKYVKGMGETLILLSEEIEKKGFTKEHKDLLSKVGSGVLFQATTFEYRNY